LLVKQKFFLIGVPIYSELTLVKVVASWLIKGVVKLEVLEGFTRVDLLAALLMLRGGGR